MRVQLSPWEVSKTTIQVPPKSRRIRKLSTADDENDSSLASNGYRNGITKSSSPLIQTEDDQFPFTARFVEVSRKKVRAWKKRVKGSSGNGQRILDDFDVLPSLIITSQHQIRLIGYSADDTLSENFNVQLTSPPGDSTSFIPHPIGVCNGSTNGKKVTLNGHVNKNSKKLGGDAVIPAIYDHLGGIIFAFQRQNTYLACWAASQSSSYVDVLASATLKQPATSLSMLPLVRHNSSVLIGSLADGNHFFVQRPSTKQQKQKDTDDERKLRIQYIPNASVRKGAKFVGSRSYVLPIRSEQEVRSQNAGSKRKISRGDSNMNEVENTVEICKVYKEHEDLIISRAEIIIDKDGDVWTDDSSTTHIEKSISLSSIVPGDTSHPAIVNTCEVVGLVEGRRLMCLHISTTIPKRMSTEIKNGANGSLPRKSSDITTRQYFLLVSLQSCEVFGAPVELPSNTTKVSLTGSSILAVETSNQNVMLYDCIRGSQILTHALTSLTHQSGTPSTEWITTFGDSERSRLAVLYIQSNTLFVASSSISTESLSEINTEDENKKAKLLLSSGRIPLANGLVTCFTNSNISPTVNSIEGSSFKGQHRTTFSLNSGSQFQATKMSSHHHDCLEVGKEILTESLSATTKQNGKSTNASSNKHHNLIDSFNKAVSAVLGKNKPPVSTNEMHATNVDETDSNNSLVAQATIDLLPQNFVDVTIDIFAKYLQMNLKTDKEISSYQRLLINDMVHILQSLVRTGKISARFHIQKLTNLGLDFQLMNQAAITDSDSSVQFLFDIIDQCLDVTERQMVSFLRSIITEAKPASIASCFEKGRLVPISKKFESLNESNDGKSEREKSSKRLIIAGVSAMIEKITSLSDPNSSLLRVAIADELSKEEIGLLVQLFGKSLTAPPNTSLILRRKMLWMSALRSFGPVDESTSSTDLSNDVMSMEYLYSLHETRQDSEQIIVSSHRHAAGNLETGSEGNRRVPDSYDDAYLVEIL